MQIVNQSRLPDAEVRELVRFAFRGVKDAGVVVKVKNSRQAYRGMAYHGVPTRSPEAGKATARRLVTIGIGPDDRFPVSNVRETNRLVQTVTVPNVCSADGSAAVYAEARKLTDLLDKDGYTSSAGFPRGGGAIVKAYRVERHPYGGKSSPLIEMQDWREALVAVAAHEARHVQQFQARARGMRTPLSEVDAERHAAKRLDAYRRQGAR
jgi:hypothetical protein